MVKRKRFLPDHIRGTGRAWKKRKRAELKAIAKAVDTFNLGCAFTPERDIYIVKDWLKTAQDALSAKNWGR